MVNNNNSSYSEEGNSIQVNQASKRARTCSLVASFKDAACAAFRADKIDMDLDL